ncbi:hypothetical protein TIFTF001_040974 [Ficus carica]|uniref:Uncharacterized protein n=1 Tax=Ficus carica TaxID=3494 RepID=A0AA88CMD8_FICCA|nr:hypothetical protein TIFTF001_040971 [Ficus carica]GMN27130.1 hypothetical protein TIFTF001_040974 [Ficus carica]
MVQSKLRTEPLYSNMSWSTVALLAPCSPTCFDSIYSVQALFERRNKSSRAGEDQQWTNLSLKRFHEPSHHRILKHNRGKDPFPLSQTIVDEDYAGHTLGFGVVEGICVVDYRPQLRLGQLDILPTFHAVRKPRCDPLPPARIHRPLQFIPLQARTRLTWKCLVKRPVRPLFGIPSRKDGYSKNWMTSTPPIPASSRPCRYMSCGPDNPLCRHLRHEGLRHKELQFNVFGKTYAAGTYAYGSVTMGDASNLSVEDAFNFANSETNPCIEEDLTPPAGRRPGDARQGSDVAGPSRRSGSLGKRKQREATNAMAYEAMEEVRDYFRGVAQTSDGSEHSVQNGGLLQCMNIMKAMGYSIYEQTLMWHYFDAHQHVMGPFCQLDDELRRSIIASVINPHQPPAF